MSDADDPPSPDAGGEPFDQAGLVAGLIGSRAEVRLVVQEQLLNDVLARWVTPRYPALRELTVRLRMENRVEARVRTTMRFLPSLTVRIDVDPVIAIEPTPHLRFRIPPEGASALILAALPQLSGRLPPGVTFSGSAGAVDLATVLAGTRAGPFVRYLTQGDVTTLTEQIVLSLTATL